MPLPALNQNWFHFPRPRPNDDIGSILRHGRGDSTISSVMPRGNEMKHG